MTIERFSFGVGDRFAHQAAPQLQAIIDLQSAGVNVAPVWNKSNREHLLVGSEPSSTRVAADAAVHELGWNRPYFCDADHIGIATVDRFIPWCDFFTIDVADFIGKPADPDRLNKFVDRHSELLAGSAPLTKDDLRRHASKYLASSEEAGRIYRHILDAKGEDFVTEVSMDETDEPQSPAALLVILAALADEGIPLQTIAPRFSGRFNKGVDYEGDLSGFEREFRADLAVLGKARELYGLPETLKLSVHSGSDKFSLYPIIGRAVRETGEGLHLKTAGATWLEEIIGLAEAGGEGLVFAKELYREALAHVDELCAPYASVISVDLAKLPSVDAVGPWSGADFVAAVRHDRADPRYNPSMRQLLHVAYKLAAKAGTRFTDLLEANADIIGKNVRENLFERHLKPLFLCG